mmetsp:Transcript_92384/g.177355  ORF Transcript_92384/g.177355 Transcript_92384/m.177355 type:complete len:216 (+) Transcript_92384:2-649(+)
MTTAPSEHAIVVRCCIQTRLRCVHTFNLPNTVYCALLREALKRILWDCSLEVDVTSVSYIWPQLQVHYAVYPAPLYDIVYKSNAGARSLPIENVINELQARSRSFKHPVDQRSWAEDLAKAGLEVQPSSAAMTYVSVGRMPVGNSCKDIRFAELLGGRIHPCSRLEIRHRLLVFRTLFANVDRVHAKGMHTHEVALVESLFRLKFDMLHHIISFL